MKINRDEKTYNLPDFMLVGAEKAGTTSLYYYLNQHPEICMSRIKEPYYFSALGRSEDNWLAKVNSSRGVVTLDDYSGLFETKTTSQKLGEASVLYLYDHNRVINNIKHIYGASASKIKILIVLRNPVERAWSSYCMKKRDGKENDDLLKVISPAVVNNRIASGWHDFCDYIGFGMYVEQIKAYQAAFDQVLILFQEDLESERVNVTIKHVFGFLDVSPDASINTSAKFNTSGTPKSAIARMLASLLYKPNLVKDFVKIPFSPKTRHFIRVYFSQFLFNKDLLPYKERQELNKLYREEVRSLEKLLNMSFRHWGLE